MREHFSKSDSSTARRDLLGSRLEGIRVVLSSVRSRFILMGLLRIGVLWLFVFCLYTFGLLVFAGAFYSVFLRVWWLLAFVWFSILFAGPLWLLYFLFRGLPDDVALAVMTEERSGIEHNFIVNAILLSRDLYWPVELVDKVILQALRHIRYVDAKKVVGFDTIRRSVVVSSVGLICVLFFSIFGFDIIKAGLNNIMVYRVTEHGGSKYVAYLPSLRDILGHLPIKVLVRPPAYTALERKTLNGLFPLEVPQGSSVEISFPAIEGIGSAYIFFRDGLKVDFTLTADNHYTAGFLADSKKEFSLIFKDINRGANDTGQAYLLPGDGGFVAIDVIIDDPPSVEVISPKDASMLPLTNLKILAECRDDYGLTSYAVYVKVDENAPFVIDAGNISNRKSAVIVSDYTIPNGVGRLEYWLVAKDNRSFGSFSPQEGRSKSYTIEITSPLDEKGEDSLQDDLTGEDERQGPLDSVDTVEGKDSYIDVQDSSFDLDKYLKNLGDLLDSFIEREKLALNSVSAVAKKVPDEFADTDRLRLEELEELQEEWQRFLDQYVDDLDKLPSQDFSVSTLRQELIEIRSELAISNENIDKESIHLAIDASEVGLELAEELRHNLERWLSEEQDYKKWDLEQPPYPIDVPLVELPEELTDIIGDLLEQEEDFYDQIEDLTSAWADSLDSGGGWNVADGPISNFSAKGITGNILPNANEVAGRSGEGREGRASGELVEEIAMGKGGRRTPGRITSDAYQDGRIMDLDKSGAGAATGGGKVSGIAAEGLSGALPSNLEDRVLRLAEKQAIILSKARILHSQAVIRGWRAEDLKNLTMMMAENVRNLRSFDLPSVLRRREIILDRFDKARRSFSSQYLVETEDSPVKKENVSGISVPLDLIRGLSYEHRLIVERYFHILDSIKSPSQ